MNISEEIERAIAELKIQGKKYPRMRTEDVIGMLDRLKNLVKESDSLPYVSDRRELFFCDFCKEYNPHTIHDHKKLKECDGCGLITKI